MFFDSIPNKRLVRQETSLRAGGEAAKSVSRRRQKGTRPNVMGPGCPVNHSKGRRWIVPHLISRNIALRKRGNPSGPLHCKRWRRWSAVWSVGAGSATKQKPGRNGSDRLNWRDNEKENRRKSIMSIKSIKSWKDLDWPHIEAQVFKMQRRIFRQSQNRNRTIMQRHQLRLLTSTSS